MMRKKQPGADMTRERFEKKWLSEGSTIEDYESSMLQSDIRKFYMLAAIVIIGQKDIDERIAERDSMGRSKLQTLVKYEELLLGLKDDIRAFSYFAIGKMHADGRESDIAALERSICDERRHLVRGVECLCDYTLASGRSVAEVLAGYSFSEFLAESGCNGLRERIEAIGPLPELADQGKDYLAASQNAEKRPRYFGTKAAAARSEFIVLFLMAAMGIAVMVLGYFLRSLGLGDIAEMVIDIGYGLV